MAAENRVEEGGPSNPIDRKEQKPTAFAETPFERNVREIGLKERPSQSTLSAVRASETSEGEAQKEDLPRIRTYANDMSEEIRRRGETITSIVGAEAKRAREEGDSAIVDPAFAKKQKRRALIIIAAIAFFVVIGASVLVFAIISHKTVPAQSAPVSLIPINERQGIEYTGDEPLSAVLGSARNAATITLGDVEEMDITKNGAGMSASDILAALGAPDALARNATAVMVGIHAFDHNQPFILVRVDAYDVAFKSMLSWESQIDGGLGDFFRPSGLAAPTINETPPQLAFSDGIVDNVDVRQSDAEWPIVYAFLRPDLLAITTNEATLRELITRLSLEKSD